MLLCAALCGVALEYWHKRFDELEKNYSLEMQVRSQFGTLRKEDMIDVQWADNAPYELLILDAGFLYFERFLQGDERQMTDVRVFVSYNQQSGSAFTDALVKKLEGKATVLRDKTHIDSWGSISEFMRSIREQDFAVAVITDAYLKSQACMYEIATMMRERDWQERLIPAVLETNIYSSAAAYVQFWAEKRQELESRVRAATDLSAMQIHTQDIERISRITAEISNFLAFVLDRNNPPIYTVLDEIEKRVLSASNTLVVPTELSD